MHQARSSEMEQNLPIVAKKFWNTLRALYFLLRKGISKAKLLADLNMTLKGAKISSKLAVINAFLFHHHHATANHHLFFDQPTFHLPFPLKKRKQQHAPPPSAADDILMMAALEMVSSEAIISPALRGIGPRPMVRQVRITDSPFPVWEIEEDNNYVDEAAEEFITKFYRNLKQQNAMAFFSPGPNYING